ncbi:MAG: Mut7-C RNAse domain-containing protein [Deltaproteobacteria bacterium]|nr:Mut7-C RNAse domain-containing protein [Deltaproteobacteria bacterium]
MRFLCDSMLGKLAKYLRVLGIDAGYSDSVLFDIKTETARSEGRTFLTRDTRVLKIRNPPEYYFVKSNFPDMQIVEVLHSFRISSSEIKPFSRCLRCNTELVSINKDDVRSRVPDYVFRNIISFSCCKMCNSVYWQGTHYERMKRWVESIEKSLSVFLLFLFF